MAAIQIPTNIINDRLSDLETEMNDAKEALERFKETRELGFLFDLARVIRYFYTNEYYLLRTKLDSVQTRRFRVLTEYFESIKSFVFFETRRLSTCKV